MQNIKTFLFIVGPLLMCCNHIWGQGAFVLDNAYVTNRVSIDKPGNPYSGIFGMEVWQSGNTNASLSGALDMAAITDSLAAYQLLGANGFHLEKTFVGQTMAQGVFWLEVIKMPGVQPYGGTVTLALVAWNSSATTWDAAVASGAKGGLVSFVQPTVGYGFGIPQLPPDVNWTVPQDLVMMDIPEPGALPLVLLSALVLLVFSKRKGKGIEFSARTTIVGLRQTVRFIISLGVTGRGLGRALSTDMADVHCPKSVRQTMKTTLKTLFIPSTLLVFAASALGQGAVLLDNSASSNRVSIHIPANPYGGTFGMEVWEANNSNPSLSGVLDMTAATNSLAAYATLAANGFHLEGTFVSQSLFQGVFSVSGIEMRDVQPPGGTVTLALATWNSAAATWDAAVAAGAKAGLIAFVQPTADYTITPPLLPENLNWTVPQDLVMLPTVPEPAVAALALVGEYILLLHRRQHHKREG